MTGHAVYYATQPRKDRSEDVFWVLRSSSGRNERKFYSREKLALYVLEKNINPELEPESVPDSRKPYRLSLLYGFDVEKIRELLGVDIRVLRAIVKERDDAFTAKKQGVMVRRRGRRKKKTYDEMRKDIDSVEDIE